MSRIAQVRQAFQVTRANDPQLVPWLAGSALLGVIVGVVVGQFLLGSLVMAVLLGILLGLLAATTVFGRRAEKVQFAAIEGEPGAAAAIVQSLRGQWWVTPAIAFSKKQDFVHLVVGRPGVILVGEGAKPRVKIMLDQEAKKMEKVTGDVPVRTVNVGDAEGQTTLRKLRGELLKMPRDLKKTEVPELARRLEALASKQQPKMPKGPIPRGRIR